MHQKRFALGALSTALLIHVKTSLYFFYKKGVCDEHVAIRLAVGPKSETTIPTTYREQEMFLGGKVSHFSCFSHVACIP